MNLTKEMKDLEYFCLLCSLSNARQEILNLLDRASVFMKGIIGKILIGGASLENQSKGSGQFVSNSDSCTY